MKIYVTRQSTIGEIQKDFRDMYPYLKLEFYKHADHANGARNGRLQASFVQGKINSGRVYVAIDISPHISTSDLEADIFETLGISAQVFRRSGNIWMCTTHTDQWSLRLQNEEGKASCNTVDFDQGLQEEE